MRGGGGGREREKSDVSTMNMQIKIPSKESMKITDICDGKVLAD